MGDETRGFKHNLELHNSNIKIFHCLFTVENGQRSSVSPWPGLPSPIWCRLPGFPLKMVVANTMVASKIVHPVSCPENKLPER